MKFIILVAIIYGFYKFTQTKKALDTRKTDQLNKEEDDEGFTEYEEVE